MPKLFKLIQIARSTELADVATCQHFNVEIILTAVWQRFQCSHGAVRKGKRAIISFVNKMYQNTARMYRLGNLCMVQ